MRFHGDAERAKAVYADVALGGPLRPEDVADCIMFALTRPANVNVDEIVVMALAQTSGVERPADDLAPLERPHLAREEYQSGRDDDHRSGAEQSRAVADHRRDRAGNRQPEWRQSDRAERVERGEPRQLLAGNLLLHRGVPENTEHLDPDPGANAATITTGSGAGPASASSGSASGKTPNVAVRRMLARRQRSITAPVSTSPIDVAASTAPHAPAPPRSCFATSGPRTKIAPLLTARTIANWSTIAQSHVRDQKSRQPSWSSCRTVLPATRRPGGRCIAWIASAATP